MHHRREATARAEFIDLLALEKEYNIWIHANSGAVNRAGPHALLRYDKRSNFLFRGKMCATRASVDIRYMQI